MPATFVSTAVWRAAPRIGLDAAVTAMAYVAGVIPAPARVAVGHCYVTYDRLERMHSRCVGHWTRWVWPLQARCPSRPRNASAHSVT